MDYFLAKAVCKSLEPMIRPGDCILIDRIGIIADGIEWLQNCKVYHIAVYVGNAMVVEAVETGVRMNSISKYNNYRYNWMVRRAKDMNEKQTEKLIETVTSYVGKDYDWWQLFTLGIFLLVKKITGKKFYKVIGQSEKDLMICSELFCRGVMEAGINLFPDVDIKAITPKMLYECDKMFTVRTMSS